jgi:UDP-N-acetylmuramoylalanine--D-glutamate ligase
VIPVTTFAGRKIAVFGLGASGLASASALFAAGADVVAWDDNTERIAYATSAGIPTADLHDIDWARITALVLTPGVPLTHPTPHWTVDLARAAGVEVIGDIELFCRERRARGPDAPLVAITGTNGKSTTTALIAHLLQTAGRDVQLGGNIGTAILSLEPPTPRRSYVIECSSYQIDLSPSLDPSVGILLNVSADHIDRHGSIENYAAVKERLVAGVPANGCAIVGVDDDWSVAAADRLERAGRPLVRVSVNRSLTDGIYVADQQIMQSRAGSAEVIAQLAGIGSLRGLHNAQNAACASAAALALNVDRKMIQQGLSACAPDGTGRPQWPRVVHQRFQGHQRRRRRPRADLLFRHFLDRRRQAQGRRYRTPKRILPAHSQSLPDRGIGEGIWHNARGQGRLRDCRDPRSRNRGGGARCGGIGALRAGGAAVPSLRLFRSIPELRGAR